MGNACTKAGREEASFLKAVKDGDYRTVQAAIVHDVEWAYKVQTWNGQNVFHLAARYGRIDVLDTVVEAVRFNPAGPEKWSKLLRMGHSTDALLRSFANLPDHRCQGPLHLAAIYGHSEVAERLLQLGASPWCWDELGGRSPLHYAASMGHVDVIRVILSHPSPQPVGEALRRPNSTRTRLVDICNDSGYTPLHYAVWADNIASVRALTSFEASLSARNVACGSDWVVSCLKCTPLHLAAHKGSLDVVKLLLSAYVQSQPHQGAEGHNNADRRRRDPRRHVNANRELPYHVAVTRNHQHLIEVLHPDVPFSFILTAAEMETRLYGVAKLVVLAARALQAKLVSDIDAAVSAMRVTAPAAAIGTNGRTRSGSIAALSGAVLTAVAGQAGTPAAAHHVLAAAAARLRSASERSAHSAHGSMDLVASAVGTAPDAVQPHAGSPGANIVALRNVGRQGSVQSTVGSSLRGCVGLNRASIDSLMGAGAAVTAAGMTATALAPGTGATVPAVTLCGDGDSGGGGGGGGGDANVEGPWQAVQAAATATLGDGAVDAVKDDLKAGSNTDSAATSKDKETLLVEAVPTPPSQHVSSSRAPAPAATPPLEAASNNQTDAPLPLPPAPISLFLPTPAGGLASNISVSSAVGLPPRPPPTFNEAATAFALFAAEPFNEQTLTQPAAGGQGRALQRSGSASITLAALVRSRVQQQTMQQEMVSALAGGGGAGGNGGGGGDNGWPLTGAGSTSVDLSVLAHSRGRGPGAGSGISSTVNGISTAADAGGPCLVASTTSVDGTGYPRLESIGPASANIVLPGAIETTPSLDAVTPSRPRSPNAAADSATLAADPSFEDSSARRHNSISIAALARRDVRVETVGPEMAAANAACTTQPADSSVMAMLASLVEAPQHVLRRYRLLQLTHGLDLQDLLWEHSQCGDLGLGSGAGGAGVGSTGNAAGVNSEGAAVLVPGIPATGPVLGARMDGGAVLGLPSGIVDWSVQPSLVGMAGPPLPAAGGPVAVAGAGALATWLAHDDTTETSVAATQTGTAPAASIPATLRAGGNGGGSGTAVVGCGGGPGEASQALLLPPAPPPPAGFCSANMVAAVDAPQAVGLSSNVSAFAALSGAPASAVGFPTAALGHLLRSLSSAAASEIGEGVCGVCFDLPDKLRIVGCGHQLCSDCSRELCKMNGFKPALCPFCRGMIGGFKFAGK